MDQPPKTDVEKAQEIAELKKIAQQLLDQRAAAAQPPKKRKLSMPSISMPSVDLGNVGKGVKKVGKKIASAPKAAYEGVENMLTSAPRMDTAGLAQLIKEELARNPHLTPEEKTERITQIFSKEYDFLYKDGVMKEAREWWQKLDSTPEGRWKKMAMSATFTTMGTVFTAAKMNIMDPTMLGTARRLGNRIGFNTALSKILSSKTAVKNFDAERVVDRRRLKLLAMGGGLGLSFLLGGPGMLVISGSAIIARGGINLMARTDLEKLAKKKKEVLDFSGINENMDMVALADFLTKTEKANKKVLASQGRVIWGQSLLNGALSIATGVASMEETKLHAAQSDDPVNQTLDKAWNKLKSIFHRGDNQETQDQETPQPNQNQNPPVSKPPEPDSTQGGTRPETPPNAGGRTGGTPPATEGRGTGGEPATSETGRSAAPAPTLPPREPAPTPSPAPILDKAGEVITEAPAGGMVQEILAKGHPLTHDFSIKLGEAGVPKSLETVFNAMAVNHMDIPAGGITEEIAAKSLNVAANLVQLSQGHMVAGVSLSEFNEAANFHDGVLNITNHTQFDQIVSKLQTHSEDLWTKGILQANNHAVSQVEQISKEDWLKIIHAEGLEKAHSLDGTTEVDTGIKGHDSITGEQVSKMAEHGPTVDELRERITNSYGENFHREVPKEGLPPLVEDKEIKMPEIKPTQPLSTPHESADATNLPHPENPIDDNPFDLSKETLLEVDMKFEDIIDNIYPEETMARWGMVEKLPAADILNIQRLPGDNLIAPLSVRLEELKNLSGLDPLPERLGYDPETISVFMKKALQKIAKDGKLGELKP